MQSRKESFSINKRWEEEHLKEVVDILERNSRHFVNIHIASPELDMKYGTDLTLTVDSGSIGLRLRRDSCNYRDFTIRSRVPSGYDTELNKIQKGIYPNWYFYGWCNNANTIGDWMILNIKKAVNFGVFKSVLPEKFNNDGTAFVSISEVFLRSVGAIVACEFKSDVSKSKGIKPCN